MYGCTYPAGVVFVKSDIMLPVEWEASNFLARWIATCFHTFYCDPLKFLNFYLFLVCLLNKTSFICTET